MILLLETATAICSVALCHQSSILHELHCSEPNAHSARLPLLVRDLMQQSGVAFHDLDAVCVSSGPGSYTGLRIGVSSAKGFCYALQRPLLAVPTLQAMAQQYYNLHPDFDGRVCPMVDARRMECYLAAYQLQKGLAQPIAEVRAAVIDADTLSPWMGSAPIAVIGDGAAKTQPLLGSLPGVLFPPDFTISAAGLAPLAEQRLANSQFEDVAYFEPFYLKDFVAKKSVVRGLYN